MLDVIQFLLSCMGGLLMALDECMLFPTISFLDFLIGITVAVILIGWFILYLRGGKT